MGGIERCERVEAASGYQRRWGGKPAGDRVPDEEEARTLRRIGQGMDGV